MLNIKRRPYLWFILPAFVLYTAIVIYPMFSTIPYSFTRWSGIGTAEFCGLQNYRQLFSDPLISKNFLNALANNGKYLIFKMFIEHLIILLIAYFIYKKVFGYRFIRIAVLSPYFVNTITFGFLVTLLFSARIGFLPTVIRIAGKPEFSTFGFVSNPRFAIFYMFVANLWKNSGYGMLLFLANFMAIPSSMIEAAQIEGAREYDIFFRIYIPMLKPSIINVSILGFINAISIFDIPFALVGTGGGIDGSMDTIAQFFYRQAFGGVNISNSMGFSTTVAVVMLIIIMFGASIQLYILNRQIAE
jgi:raffinose/stachyose/melibiose transport system permease protein